MSEKDRFVKVKYESREISIRKLKDADEFLSWAAILENVAMGETMMRGVFRSQWNRAATQTALLRQPTKPKRDESANIAKANQQRKACEGVGVKPNGNILLSRWDLNEVRVAEENYPGKMNETILLYDSELKRVQDEWESHEKCLNADRVLKNLIEEALPKELYNRVRDIIKDPSASAFQVFAKLKTQMLTKSVDAKDRAEEMLNSVRLRDADFALFLAHFREKWADARNKGLIMTGDRIWSKVRAGATKEFEGTNDYAFNSLSNFLADAEQRFPEYLDLNEKAYELHEDETSANPKWLRDRMDFLELRFSRMSASQRASIIGKGTRVNHLKGKTGKSAEKTQNSVEDELMNNVEEGSVTLKALLSLINSIKDDKTRKKGTQPQSLTCFNCNKSGHRSIECRGAKATCTHCKREGHLEMHCRSKKKEAAK